MTNNLLGVILPLVAFGLPGSVVILRGFANIPGELENVTYIDGCTTLDIFRFTLLPLAQSAIITVAVLQMIAARNEYFLPLLVVSSNPDLWPLPLGIMQFQG